MNKIWRIAILLIILIAFIVWFNSCKTTQEVVEQRQPEVQTVEQLPKIPWLVDKDIYIEAGDPIRFYNQYDIIVQGKIPIKIKSYHNGNFSTKDSSISFDYSVPAETKGELIKVEHNRGQPSYFTVRFDHLLKIQDQNLGEQDTTAYDHVFPLQSNKEFSISLHPKIIKIAGEDRSVNLGLHGDGTKKCRLMYVPEYSNSESTIGAPASGVPDIIGTKIIKKQ